MHHGKRLSDIERSARIAVGCSAVLLLLRQLPRLHPNLLGHLLQALEREVAFAALYPTHVGAVDAKDVCEGFLAQASLQPVGTQIPAHRLLEITNSHIPQPGHLLLEGLQTDE